MKRNETKTRTVWYFRMDDKDIKAFNNLQDACGFARDYLSKKFGKVYSASRFEDGSVVFSSRVVETKVIGSSSYPEMVNARYEDSLKATEPVVEESKPSSQIVWRYKVQFQWAGCKTVGKIVIASVVFVLMTIHRTMTWTQFVVNTKTQKRHCKKR